MFTPELDVSVPRANESHLRCSIVHVSAAVGESGTREFTVELVL